MANDIPGGDIISRWILKSDNFRAGVEQGIGIANRARLTLQNAFTAGGNALNAFRGKAEENAGSMAGIAATAFVPMTLAVINFASQNQVAIDKIATLQERIKDAPTYAIPGIQAEIDRLKSIEMQTRLAKQETDKLAFAGKALAFEIGKLVFKALQPFFGTLINAVRASILWLQTNRELATNIVVLVAKVGALFAVMAPGLTVIAKLSGILGTLLSIVSVMFSPLGLLALAIGGLVYLFRDSLYPSVEKILPKLSELWDSWSKGRITTEDALDGIGSAIAEFAKNAVIDINKLIDSKTGVFSALEDTLTNILILWDRTKPIREFFSPTISQAQAAINLADPRNQLPLIPTLSASGGTTSTSTTNVFNGLDSEGMRRVSDTLRNETDRMIRSALGGG